jgi:hypothetical protein
VLTWTAVPPPIAEIPICWVEAYGTPKLLGDPVFRAVVAKPRPTTFAVDLECVRAQDGRLRAGHSLATVASWMSIRRAGQTGLVNPTKVKPLHGSALWPVAMDARSWRTSDSVTNTVDSSRRKSRRS